MRSYGCALPVPDFSDEYRKTLLWPQSELVTQGSGDQHMYTLYTLYIMYILYTLYTMYTLYILYTLYTRYILYIVYSLYVFYRL